MLGKWNKIEKDGEWKWECSMCKHTQEFRTRYCEYCKMEMEDGLENHQKEEMNESISD